jgi:hypothetical protein
LQIGATFKFFDTWFGLCLAIKMPWSASFDQERDPDERSVSGAKEYPQTMLKIIENGEGICGPFCLPDEDMVSTLVGPPWQPKLREPEG